MTSPLPTTMRAIRITTYNAPYTLTRTPTPTDLAPHDLLVKVAVASNCHTDALVASGTFSTRLPCTASHEGAGTIASLGSAAASDFGFQVGTRVMCGLPLRPCGECDECTGPESQRQYCTRARHVGVHVDGCFAEYVRVDARSTVEVPSAVSLLSAAPLACAGRTIWKGLLRTGLGPGEWVGIVGSGGGLGHLGVQFARALGLRVVGVDARDEGLELSRESGAEVVVDARGGKEKVVEEVRRVTGGHGVGSAVCISDAPGAAALACAVTRMHGTVVQIAQPDEVVIPFPEIIFRDIRIQGSLICSAEESRGMLECVAKHGVEVKTNPFYGLEKIHELTEMVHGGKIKGKAVIVVDEEQLKHEKTIGAKF